MATESPIRIVETADRWSTLKQSTRYGPSSAKMAVEGLGLFPKDPRSQSHEKDVLPSRCESAPPSMEGSLATIGNIFSHRKSTLNRASKYPSIYATNIHTELQFHDRPSSSSSYHGTDVTLDQRLSETINSLESSHVYQRTGTTSGGKMANAKCADNSLQLPRNSLLTHKEGSENGHSSEQSASVAVGKAAFLGYQSRSVDLVEEGSYHASTPSHGQFQSSNNKSMGKTVVSDTKSQFLHNVSASISTADANTPCLDDMEQFLSLDGQRGLFVYPPVHQRDFNAVKDDTLDDHSTAGGGDVDGAHFEAIKSVNLLTASNLDSQKLLKKDLFIPQNEVLQHQAASPECNTSQFQGASSQIIYTGTSHAYGSLNQFHHNSSNVSTTEVQPILQSSGFTAPLYASQAVFMTSPSSFYPNVQPAGFFTPRYNLSGYNPNPAVPTACLAGYPHEGTAPLAFDGAPFTQSGAPNGGILHAYDPQNQLKYYSQIGVPVQPPFYMHYFQQPVRDPYGTYSHFAHQTPRGGAVVNQVNSRFSQKGAELVGSSHDPKVQHLHGTGYNNLNMETLNVSSHYFGSLTNAGPVLQFPAPSAVSHVARAKPAMGTNFPGGTYNTSFSPSTGNSSKTNRQSQGWTNMNSYSLLEELKSSKGQRFELSDIAGHIVEFSIDQHGSRFIQQKLETCSVEEKISVFKEVVPHASKLITDVFGNYVIQKLFEYGSPEQRKYLADQLEGLILQLSLQMYGCRVIQKALDVIDLEQKASLVGELDGHVLKCVRDQNGNHVIQKCIESIPTDKIHFIISSFHGQVAMLSMHPYGCRVIQRVLEHCNDEMRTQFIVDEILDSVCSLAQDQYGNYVTQHVLARGKPRERSEIIEKLTGSIVKLSQNKFASNVVEKCLEHSDSTTRGMLIKEIIGHGDKNDNLLIMMKDQYANYVVQKILEICSSDQRELLLGLIRNHLTALKKYTYGKHIVTRFEQLYGDELQTSGS